MKKRRRGGGGDRGGGERNRQQEHLAGKEGRERKSGLTKANGSRRS